MVKKEKLFDTYLYLVKCIIHDLGFQNCVVGLEYEDVYQVGCIALWQATEKYNGTVPFPSFARKVIQNALINNYKKWHLKINCVEMTEDIADVQDRFDITKIDVDHILRAKWKTSKGVKRKGIYALGMRLNGYTNKDIAYIWKVSNHYIGSCISYAVKSLQEDVRIEEFVA